MIKITVIGGAGYTAGELIRILLHHPNVESLSVVSQSHAGEPVHAAHNDLLGETDLVFEKEPAKDVDLVFLCLGHGKSKEYLGSHGFNGAKIIDLSHDFRLQGHSVFNDKRFT